MSKTTVPAAAVTIAIVKITKNAQGWFVLRSQELGNMAVAATREVLRTIAGNRGWTVVKAWA